MGAAMTDNSLLTDIDLQVRPSRAQLGCSQMWVSSLSHRAYHCLLCVSSHAHDQTVAQQKRLNFPMQG